jgi:hypothetical protein
MQQKIIENRILQKMKTKNARPVTMRMMSLVFLLEVINSAHQDVVVVVVPSPESVINSSIASPNCTIRMMSSRRPNRTMKLVIIKLQGSLALPPNASPNSKTLMMTNGK